MLQCINTKFSHKVDNHSVLHCSYKKENWTMCPNVWFSKIGSHNYVMIEKLKDKNKNAQLFSIVYHKSIKALVRKL